jgi:hypothetical protein
MQGWPWPFTFENGDLLPQGENLKGRVAELRTKTRITETMESMNSGTNSPL